MTIKLNNHPSHPSLGMEYASYIYPSSTAPSAAVATTAATTATTTALLLSTLGNFRYKDAHVCVDEDELTTLSQLQGPRQLVTADDQIGERGVRGSAEVGRYRT